MSLALQAKKITKRFPGVLANDHVDFDLEKGEIHALLGENGAGKTTLMNVIYGLYQPDEGEISLDGKLLSIHSPKDAIAYGIGMVHQHFMLIPVFTVAENIMLGAETVRRFGETVHRFLEQVFLDRTLLGRLGRALDTTPIGRLSRALNTTSLGLLGRVLLAVLFVIWLGLIKTVPFLGLLGGFLLLLVGLGRMLDRRGVTVKVRELSHQYGLDVDPDAHVSDLPVGVQQRVEIIKALYRKADILILDEPTAVLTPQEAEDLFRIMRELASQGISIIFITHKLKEVLNVADRITVMRAGQVVGTVNPQEVDEAHLAEMMVGREVILKVKKGAAHPGKEVLRVTDLHVSDDRGVEVVQGASFSVRAGEVLGIAGVQGNGQTELVEVLTGLRQAHSGKVVMLERDVTNKPPRPIIETGVAHVPEDRQRYGLVLPYPITDNLVLCTYYLPPFAKNGILDHKVIDENGRRLVSEFDVRTPSPYIPASKLSGGNQQKVIVARELSRPIKLLIANQPTRGLDVGSIEYIHKTIVRMRDAGCGVLLVSAELDEIMSLADRIAVIYKGQILDTLPAEEATKEALGLLMAGVENVKKGF